MPAKNALTDLFTFNRVYIFHEQFLKQIHTKNLCQNSILLLILSLYFSLSLFLSLPLSPSISLPSSEETPGRQRCNHVHV